MKTFEYECPVCHKTFEVQLSETQDTRMCIYCGATANKIMSTINIRFKGAGFSCNDKLADPKQVLGDKWRKDGNYE